MPITTIDSEPSLYLSTCSSLRLESGQGLLYARRATARKRWRCATGYDLRRLILLARGLTSALRILSSFYGLHRARVVTLNSSCR
jgi:hypothetical protein